MSQFSTNDPILSVNALRVGFLARIFDANTDPHRDFSWNRKTPLDESHLAAGEKYWVDFSAAGHASALTGSQIEEHNQVRNAAGVFDVSQHDRGRRVRERTPKTGALLLSNDGRGLRAPGKALYSLLLNQDGGVVDDLIVYRTGAGYRMVSNCATRRKVLIWLAQNSRGFSVQVEERPNLAMLAVHGPNSISLACEALPADSVEPVRQLGNFGSLEQGGWLIARTGYTGELGLEVILPANSRRILGQVAAARGETAGLGARDTLRLEARQ